MRKNGDAVHCEGKKDWVANFVAYAATVWWCECAGIDGQNVHCFFFCFMW